MTTYDLTKKSKASTGERRVYFDGTDPNIDIRLSTLEKKMDKLIETLTKKE